MERSELRRYNDTRLIITAYMRWGWDTASEDLDEADTPRFHQVYASKAFSMRERKLFIGKMEEAIQWHFTRLWDQVDDKILEEFGYGQTEKR